MKKNKKIALIACSVVAAVAVLTAGTLALFTARTDGNFSAKAGTVTVALGDISLSNSQNVNPGDNDPNNPNGATGGTAHKLTYDISNNGSKSIRTRQTIILSVKNASDVASLDARYLALYNSGRELTGKTYVLTDNREVTSLNASDKVKAIKYVFIGDIFDGKGVDINKGGDAEKESVSNVVTQGANGQVVKGYTYDFALLRTAGNEYQGCNIDATITVEAMQYRNTDVSDWSQAAVVKQSYSTSNVSINVVPSVNEDKNGNYIN